MIETDQKELPLLNSQKLNLSIKPFPSVELNYVEEIWILKKLNQKEKEIVWVVDLVLNNKDH